jgi:hypothetical protein
MTEGPLDLTIPLNIAEVRAALSTTGSQAKAKPAAASASAASARPPENRGGSRHGGPRRLGRIAAFVAVTAALSVGTAGALVLSNNSSNPSVSLPASGAIPVAPSSNSPQTGQHSMGSGSTSAHATPSLSHSAANPDPVDVGHSAGRTTTSDTGSASSSAGGAASASASASGTGATGFPPLPSTPADWQTLYQGETTSTQQAQETADVQTLLNNIGYLQPWRHQTYVLPAYSPYAAGPDADGYYGSATSDAIATFQEYYSIPHSGQLGECDLETYEALIQLIESAASNQTAEANQTSQSTAQSTSTSTAQPNSNQTPQ